MLVLPGALYLLEDLLNLSVFSGVPYLMPTPLYKHQRPCYALVNRCIPLPDGCHCLPNKKSIASAHHSFIISTPFVSHCARSPFPKPSGGWFLLMGHFSVRCWALHWLPLSMSPSPSLYDSGLADFLPLLACLNVSFFCIKIHIYKIYHFNPLKIYNAVRFNAFKTSHHCCLV
jgi:hypothetical protein